jgi:hypothetical protein
MIFFLLQDKEGFELMIISGRHSIKSSLWAVVAVALCITACHDRSESAAPFDFGDCLENIPEQVEGLKIISGPRTQQNIIHDMVPAICGGHALFERMKESGDAIEPGSVVFRVVVEYTGEVNRVTVEETTIQSEPFVRKVRDLVLNTDFVYWRGKDDDDSEFVYPVRFGRYE